jgi:hypothetical protein
MPKSRLKLCAHRALDGSRCRGAAMRQSNYCRHHDRAHRPVFPAWVFEPATIDEFQSAIDRTVAGLTNGTINQKLSGQILDQLARGIRALARQPR